MEHSFTNTLKVSREIFIDIFARLPYKDAIQLCMTNQDFLDLCKTNYLWYVKTLHDFENLYDVDDPTVDNWKKQYQIYRQNLEKDLVLYIGKRNISAVETAIFVDVNLDEKHIIKKNYLGRDIYTRPLIVASHVGNLDIVKLLLEYGADPNIKDSEGDTSLKVAIEKGHIDIVDLLLEYGAE